MPEYHYRTELVLGRHVCLDDLIGLPRSTGWHRVSDVSLHIDPIEVLLQTEEGARVVGAIHPVHVYRPQVQSPGPSRVDEGAARYVANLGDAVRRAEGR